MGTAGIPAPNPSAAARQRLPAALADAPFQLAALLPQQFVIPPNQRRDVLGPVVWPANAAAYFLALAQHGRFDRPQAKLDFLNPGGFIPGALFGLALRCCAFLFAVTRHDQAPHHADSQPNPQAISLSTVR